MVFPRPIALARLAFVAFALLIVSHHADAQLMSKWGHPVFSIGWTPYDAVSTGHGNYPGSNGFIPGYGNYPGDRPGHYPWYDGPANHGQPFSQPLYVPGQAGPPGVTYQGETHDPVFAGQPASQQEDAPATAAVLRVRVPPQAELWFSGHKTVQQGSLRRFLTPPLASDNNLVYEVRVRWQEKGKAVEQTREVQVYPGDRLTVDFIGPSPTQERSVPGGAPNTDD